MTLNGSKAGLDNGRMEEKMKTTFNTFFFLLYTTNVTQLYSHVLYFFCMSEPEGLVECLELLQCQQLEQIQ